MANMTALKTFFLANFNSIFYITGRLSVSIFFQCLLLEPAFGLLPFLNETQTVGCNANT